MNISLSLSDVIAIAALLLSGYATWTTARFNSRQKSLLESQEALNKRLLARDSAESEHAQRADIGAKLIKVGTSYRIRVFNKGMASATQVQIDFPNGNKIASESDMARKFPLEALEPLQSVDVLANVYLGSDSKHVARFRWVDGFSDSNEKQVYLTI